MTNSETILITGASGQLGRLVIAAVKRRAAAANIVAMVRDAAKASDLAEQGVELRVADYNDLLALSSAMMGVDKLLLISSSEVGQRSVQHRNVVKAAMVAGIKLIAYTSLLHADSSPMALAVEHRETEQAIRGSGLPFTLLRNGWYSENYTQGVAAALEHGVVLGAAGDGLLSLAARQDYAEAAAAVLLVDAARHAGKVYELAGDHACTLADLAAEITRQSGKPVRYQDLPEAEYKAELIGFGLPEGFAELLAESDAKAARGALYEPGQTLSQLIGRPTTPLRDSVAAALALQSRA
ncbi:SDR family oxidoreductase [Ectopseudomonas guguanensis]|jgi:NAD(P)H dehydrogenase (quinone)|nr:MULTISPECIES: SDR family oxidoreductase [Pseudomonas]MPT17087.1 SDR family oxidoreductase [Pseudomonas sp.]WJH58255.1 SDR family oxidoreductase [Pseudomonas guguanensis]